MRNRTLTSSFPAEVEKAPARRRGAWGRVAAVGAAWLLAASLVGACSYVPDAANPVSWYKGVAGWFGGEEEEAAPEVAEVPPAEPPGAEQSFPTLSDVPDKPVPVTTVEERRRMMQGLAGDREHARYSDEVSEEPELRAPEPEPMPAPPVPKAPAPPPRMSVKPPPPISVEPPPAEQLEAPPPPPPPPLAQREAPPPPAPRAAPRVPVEPQAPEAPAPKSVEEVYEAKLEQSATTVTTAPVGPTAEAAGTTLVTEPSEEQVAALGPRPLSDFDPSRSVLSAQVGTVLFGHGSAVLTPAGRKVLREVARMHKERGGTIRVIGHASSRTRDMDPVRHQLANFAISMRRADVVARELMRLGVKPDKIFVGAKSDSEPIYYESMPAGEAGNRRAEIFIDY